MRERGPIFTLEDEVVAKNIPIEPLIADKSSKESLLEVKEENENKKTLDKLLNWFKKNHKENVLNFPNASILTSFLRSTPLRAILIGGLTMALLPKENKKEDVSHPPLVEYVDSEYNEGEIEEETTLEQFEEAQSKFREHVSGLIDLPINSEIYNDIIPYDEKITMIDKLSDLDIDLYMDAYLSFLDVRSGYVSSLEESGGEDKEVRGITRFPVRKDLLSRYPELHALGEINSKAQELKDKPYLLLIPDFVKSLEGARETAVNEFSRYRENRLMEGLTEFVEQKITEGLRVVYDGLRPVFFVTLEGGRDFELDFEHFSDSDLGIDLAEIVERHVKKGEHVEFKFDVNEGLVEVRGGFSFNEFTLSYIVNSDTNNPKYINLANYYHPAFVGERVGLDLLQKITSGSVVESDSEIELQDLVSELASIHDQDHNLTEREKEIFGSFVAQYRAFWDFYSKEKKHGNISGETMYELAKMLDKCRSGGDLWDQFNDEIPEDLRRKVNNNLRLLSESSHNIDERMLKAYEEAFEADYETIDEWVGDSIDQEVEIKRQINTFLENMKGAFDEEGLDVTSSDEPETQIKEVLDEGGSYEEGYDEVERYGRGEEGGLEDEGQYDEDGEEDEGVGELEKAQEELDRQQGELEKLTEEYRGLQEQLDMLPNETEEESLEEGGGGEGEYNENAVEENQGEDEEEGY